MFIPTLFLFFALGTHKKGELNVPPSVELRVSSTSELQTPFFNSWGEPQSDSDGYVYFHAATSDYNNSTILAVSPKDSQPLVFAVKGELGRTNFFEGFHVTPSGRVYVFTSNSDHATKVFQFDHDGDTKNPVELQIPSTVYVDALGVFERTGNMLLWGYFGKRAPEAQKGKPFTALLDPSGRVIRYLSEGKKIRDLKTAEKPTESCLQLGPDGNMYVLSSDHILIVNESGRVQRRIALVKGDRNSGSLATKLVISGETAAIWLTTDPDISRDIGLTLETIDLSTGNVSGSYLPSADLGNNAVSFSSETGFMFFKNSKGRIEVLGASIH